jgi:hypothetical protein
MPLRYRIGHAFRWRLTKQACELSDLIRIRDEAGVLMIALANGHEDGWSTCWAKGSRLVLDLLLEAWLAAGGELAERAPAAIDEVRRQFPARARALLPAEPDDLSGPPGATLLVGSLDGASGRFDWIGPDSGLLIRGGTIASQTTPHTLGEHMRAQGIPEATLTKLSSVVMRSISEHVTPGFESRSGAQTFSLEDGDCLLLVNDALRRSLTTDDLVACARTHDAPYALAEELVGRAFDRGGVVYAAAVVVRCDAVSCASTR